MVYDREYDGRTLSFEPSGALMTAALVMRDMETDSWWSITTGDGIGGDLEGVRLREIPGGEKVLWGNWKKRYPETKILSVEEAQHDPYDSYEEYFESDKGFRGLESADKRLPDKESVYSFRMEGIAYAVTYSRIEGGVVFRIGDREIFLFREPDAHLFASTAAWVAPASGDTLEVNRFRKIDGDWRDTVTGAVFSLEGGFQLDSGSGTDLERLTGFDTFWYNWAAIPEEITILE